MIYSFDTDLACELGVNEAILLNNLVFWIAKNKANNKNFFEGRYWTYNTAEAFKELFSFWSVRQIRYSLSKLQKQGVILSGKFNKNKNDKTKWYALTDDYLYLITPKVKTKMSQGCDKIVSEACDKIVTSYNIQIENINTDSNTNISTNDATQKEEIKSEFDYSGFNNEEAEAINDWLSYKRTLKVKDATIRSVMIKKIRGKCLAYSTKGMLVEAINNSIANGYTGLIEPRELKGRSLPKKETVQELQSNKNRDYFEGTF